MLPPVGSIPEPVTVIQRAIELAHRSDNCLTHSQAIEFCVFKPTILANPLYESEIARMIPRQAQQTLERLAKGFPILVITGPRQSGKTTLARATFPAHDYVSLEDLENLPEPDELAEEIIENLEAGLESFRAVLAQL